MLKLKFNKFIERYKLQVEGNNKSTLHYMEEEDKFTLYFKNKEYWEYYSVVNKSDIIEFGNLYSDDVNIAIEDFRINYLTHAVPVIKEDMIDLPDTKEPSELSTPLPEINKSTNDDIDVIDESKDYETFFINIVNDWETKTLNALKFIDIDKVYNSDKFNKTFGEFIRSLFNNVHTRKFLLKLRGIIKNSMTEGINSAEEETNVNIVWGETFNNKLKTFENQQLDGYTINGKKWYGIKGASQELRMKILKSVQEDIQNRVSRNNMAKNIKEIFQGSTIAQAKRIARTETTRFINETKLTGWVETGIKGYKAWSAVMDKNTGDADRRMHNKYNKIGIPFDEAFEDDITGKRVMNPPLHPNCRCVIEFRLPPKKDNSI